MQEYLSEAVVLHHESSGNEDARISLFTKRFGKLIARAKSARKINSKLAGHLQPGNLVFVRLIERNGLQAVDALKTKTLSLPLSDIYSLHALLAEREPELELWQMLKDGKFEWRRVLRILGWDPNSAHCATCKKDPSHFYPHTQEFFCDSCASQFAGNKLFLIGI